MARVQLRRQALELRRQGKSYSQIKKELGVSKSTLSDWLKQYPLSREQIRLLRDLNEVRIEKYRQTMQQKREVKLLKYYKNQEEYLLPLTKKELFIAGLFLYWGEGGKMLKHTISINNTDPAVLKFSLYWIVNALDVPKEKVRVYLHLYTDMNMEEAMIFWSKALNIPKEQFMRPYIKESSRTEIDHKGFGKGTCTLIVYNTVIKENILMAIKVMGDYANGRIQEL